MPYRLPSLINAAHDLIYAAPAGYWNQVQPIVWDQQLQPVSVQLPDVIDPSGEG
jgi:hypothetical protein